jgi:hypothetical protein
LKFNFYQNLTNYEFLKNSKNLKLNNFLTTSYSTENNFLVLNKNYNNIIVRANNKKNSWSNSLENSNDFLNLNFLKNDFFYDRKTQINLKNNLHNFFINNKFNTNNNLLYNYNDFLEVNR